jgi:hypothetical protein
VQYTRFRCDDVDLAEVIQDFPCQIKIFPCTYLGLPLQIKQLRRVDIQPVIDKLGKRLSSWKGRFLNKAGRLKLVNTVLTSMSVYCLTASAPKKWAIKKLDRVKRSFL